MRKLITILVVITILGVLTGCSKREPSIVDDAIVEVATVEFLVDDKVYSAYDLKDLDTVPTVVKARYRKTDGEEVVKSCYITYNHNKEEKVCKFMDDRYCRLILPYKED